MACNFNYHLVNEGFVKVTASQYTVNVIIMRMRGSALRSVRSQSQWEKPDFSPTPSQNPKPFYMMIQIYLYVRRGNGCTKFGENQFGHNKSAHV